MQPYLIGIAHEVQDQTDIVFTPDDVARDVVAHFKPSGRCLDPCRGDGAFLKHLPEGSEYCELSEGKDFFHWDKRVDWIVSNPPYSTFPDWLDHTFTVAKNAVYLIPLHKVFNSYDIMQKISRWGGVKEVFMIAPGRRIGFPFGFGVAAVHLKKGYKGRTKFTFR